MSLVDEPEIHLVDQCRRLQGVLGARFDMLRRGATPHKRWAATD
jgi:hypothetical protein